jgi:deoxyguanosine kinase
MKRSGGRARATPTTSPRTRIEICGGVASGKTTLCNVLMETGLTSVFENFSSNPFWSLFYQDPHTYAFETEVTFLLQHYSLIKTVSLSTSPFACDFSLLQDQAYADMNLSGGHLAAFQAVYAQAVEEIRSAALIVHLQCRAEEELWRIRRRARTEEQTVQLSYLDDLNKAISRVVEDARRHIPVIQIDSSTIDFANNPDEKKIISARILDAVRRK